MTEPPVQHRAIDLCVCNGWRGEHDAVGEIFGKCTGFMPHPQPMMSTRFSAPPEVQEVKFLVRPFRGSDGPFTYSSFLRSYRESDYTDGIPNTLFFDVHKQEWAAVLALFTVIVAHPEGDEDEIAGFIAFKERTVAWIYVKHTPWRRMGVATLLMREAGFLPGREVKALFGSSWALSNARAAGYRVSLAPHVEAVRLLLGVA
jgi:hypothetical protein